MPWRCNTSDQRTLRRPGNWDPRNYLSLIRLQAALRRQAFPTCNARLGHPGAREGAGEGASGAD